MLQKLYRILLPAFIMVLPASFASAASFSLPPDAVIHIEAFSFPEASANTAEQNLPELLLGRMTDALQQAGFKVEHTVAAPAVSPGSPSSPTASNSPDSEGAEKEKSVTATPITESGEAKTPKPEESAPAKEDAAANKTAETETPPANQTPVESDQSNVIQSVFVGAATPGPEAYTLEGRVTLLRENISAPLRIGGGVRIRAEAVIHCTYRVKDASGKTLISATASGSLARLTSAQNVDAVLADLTAKIMASAAEQIASRLSGVEVSPPSSPHASEKEYYQDSPGKRLRKE